MEVFWIKRIINIIYFIVCAIVSRKIMKKKGYNQDANTWFWMGLLFGIIALIIVLLKPKNEEDQKKSEW